MIEIHDGYGNYWDPVNKKWSKEPVIVRHEEIWEADYEFYPDQAI